MIRLGICNELFEGWEFGQVCRTVKGLGYEGLEIAPFTLAPWITDLTADRRRELRAMVEDAGLATIGLHWLLAKTEGFYLTSPDPEVRRRTGDYLIALAEATRDLGGSLMVLGSPKQRDLLPGVSERSATTESGAASGQRMPFPDYVSAQGPVPIPWTPMDPVVFSLLRRAALVDPQRPCGCAWGDTSRMVGDCLTTLPLG